MNSLAVSIISVTSTASIILLIFCIVFRAKLASERSRLGFLLANLKSLEDSNSATVTHFATERSKTLKGQAALQAEIDRATETTAAIRLERNRLAAENAALTQKYTTEVSELNRRLQVYSPIMEIEAEIDKRNYELSKLGRSISALDATIGEKASLIKELDAQIEKLESVNELQSLGFYENKYSFDTPDAYKERLDGVLFAQKQMLKSKIAAHCNAEWAVNGSKAEGRKQTNQTLKLITRAFNGESDASIAKVKYSNINQMEERIRKAYQTINSLVGVQQCYISHDYFNLKLQELYLVHEYREKQQIAKEEQRAVRARLRDEEIARREIEAALQTAEKDEVKYSTALEEAKREIESAAGAKQQRLLDHIANLERKLSEALTLKERALSRAQLTRSGHIYIISNLGAFGENIFKIGMTRRLDPLERVLELGDASVPFRFDIHAIVYSDDAPDLEAKLHRRFHDRRLNKINFKKEFFRAELDEIEFAVREFCGDIEFRKFVEAEEYRKTMAILNPIVDGNRPPDGNPVLEIR